VEKIRRIFSPENRFRMHSYRFCAVAAIALSTAFLSPAQSVPRTADGKPDLQGFWQASSTAAADLQDHVAGLNMLAGRSVVDGGSIPYQPAAARQRAENFQNRQTADPLSKCYMPGVPRVMYLDFPFQIFQTPKAVAMAFEWELDFRLIPMDGSPHPDDGGNLWMGDSRGRWDGDTLVVDVSNMNDKTWLDMAGDFHTDALHVVERYRMTDRDTIQYEATLDDAKVFTKPWTIHIALHRRTDRDRLFEYSCESELEEVTGAFTREDRTWYPGSPTAPPIAMTASTRVPPAPVEAAANLRRTPDGKPDLQGFYESKARGANQGLERRARGGGRGAAAASGAPAAAPTGPIVDPPDGKLPMQPWAVEERVSRNLAERGYDDPTAHCFPAGFPRSMYIPEGLEIIQTHDYLLFMYERVSWRIVPLDGRAHLPDTMRLWQGDSVGHWEGDTLVIDTANFNGKTWLDEGGEIVSYAEHVVERFTPVDNETVNYEATVTDPVVYTRPWTIAFPMKREKFELREAACHEEDHDLPHLKALKDAAAAKKK
jgi:hypothetical protein